MDGVANIINDLAKRSIEANKANEGDYYDDEGLLVCGVCRKNKQCKITVFGEEKTVGCICQCEVDKQNAEKAEREREDREKRIRELRRTGFPESDMQKWTFANDDMANPKITQAMQRYVDKFSEFRKEGKGLLLYGSVGTGKTYAACEIANALIDKGYPVLVTNFARLINTLQGTFEKQEYIDSLNQFQLIVIDDLGIERDTSFAREQVYNIIDGRYRAGLPMIITTNLSIDKIKKPDDIENKRIYDRILERCFPIEITGNSRRIKAVRESYNDMKELLGL